MVMNGQMLKRYFVLFAVVFALCTLAAPLSHADGVSVTGLVKFEGKPPMRRPIETRADDYCVDMHSDKPLLTDSAVIDENGAFAHIFVWIDNPKAGDYAPPTSPFVLNQEGCRYTTHVFGIMVGQTLMVKNSDETTHNVRGFARANRPFNFGQPPGLKPRTRVKVVPPTIITKENSAVRDSSPASFSEY